MDQGTILSQVEAYYADKLSKHGPTPQGVDWNSEQSQQLRFAQLSKAFENAEQPLSILDYGCGFGSMYAYLEKQPKKISFLGYDISPAMIAQAKTLYSKENTHWINSLEGTQPVDYVVASGIFNVRLKTEDKDWEAYIIDILHQFNSLATKGFAFNMLTSYSDADRMRDYLYYANPSFFFDYCKRHFSKQVALLHDYPLYEFTIIVRK